MINARWHKTHIMPRNATAAQRLKWHVAHEMHCACREMPAAMRKKLERLARARIVAARKVRSKRKKST